MALRATICLLDSDEETSYTGTITNASVASRASHSGGGSQTAAIDLTDDAVEATPGPAVDQTLERHICALCGVAVPRGPGAYVLNGCRQSGCRRRNHRKCLEAHVAQELAEKVPDEVGCPACGKQLSIRDITELSRDIDGNRPSAEASPASKRHKSTGPWPPASSSASIGRPGGGALGRVAGSASATKRIMKELQAIQRSPEAASQGIAVSVPDEADAYHWQAEFFDFEKGSPLAKDLSRVPGGRIVLSVRFSSAFPSAPPYVRVIRPRFAFRTGHVTIGGSICTEMLTNQGWTPTMTMESVLLGVRTNMLIGGARLDLRITADYSEQEARMAFDRMVREHGWF
jgi:ubiquitin-protein ligase